MTGGQTIRGGNIGPRYLYIRSLIGAAIAFVAVAFAGDAQPQPKPGHGTLLIEVAGLRGSEGTIRAALWDAKTGFPSEVEHAWRRTTAKITDAESHLEFEEVPYGRWAISLFHDENANEELDRNFLGIPTEGIGASNNRVGRFSAPVFEDATFRLEEPRKVLSIELRHH